jgi:hypothetical protein
MSVKSLKSFKLSIFSESETTEENMDFTPDLVNYLQNELCVPELILKRLEDIRFYKSMMLTFPIVLGPDPVYNFAEVKQ